ALPLRIERIKVRIRQVDAPATRRTAESTSIAALSDCKSAGQAPIVEVDSGDRPLGNIVLIHGSDDPRVVSRADETIAAFVRDALLQLVDARSPAASPLQTQTSRRATLAASAVVADGLLHCRTAGGRSFELLQSAGGWQLSNGTGVVSARDLGLGFPTPPADSVIDNGPEVADWPGYRQQLTKPDMELPAGSDVVDLDNPARGVQSRLQSIRTSLAESDELEQRCGELDGTLQDLRSQRARAVELRSAARRKLRRIAELRPVQFHLQQLERWRSQAGDLDELRQLPENPGAVLEQLSSRLEALRGHITTREQGVQSLRPAIDGFDERAREMLSREGEIEELLRVAARLPQQETCCQDLYLAIEQLDAALLQHAAEFTDSELSAEETAALTAVDSKALLQAFVPLEEKRTLRAARRAELERHQGRKPEAAPSFPWLSVTSTVAVAATAITLWTTMIPVLVGVSAVAVGTLAFLTTQWWSRRGEAQRRAAAHLSRSVALEAEQRVLDKAIRPIERTIAETLAPLPMRAVLLAEPTRDLMDPIVAAQDAIARRTALQQELDELTEVVAAAHEQVEGVASSLTEWEAGHELRAAQALREGVIDAHEQRARADQARHEETRLVAELVDLRQRQGLLIEERRALQGRLRKVAPGAENACRVVRERHRALRAAEWLEAHLRRDVADLDALRSELSLAASRGEEWLTDDEAVANLTRLTETLDDEMIELDRAIVELRLELEVLDTRPGSDVLRARAGELEKDLSQLTSRRDELRRITTLLADADREFVAEHQPIIVARANEYLWRIAGCAPADLHFLVQTERGELRVKTRNGASTVDPAVLPPARLALRLALIEQLEEPGETLPLLVGDPTSLASEQHRRRALAVLREVSRDRQVFVFCESARVFGLPEVRDFRSDRRVTTSRVAMSTPPQPAEVSEETWFAAWRERLSTLARHFQSRSAAPPPRLTSGHDLAAERDAQATGKAMQLLGRVAERLRSTPPKRQAGENPAVDNPVPRTLDTAAEPSPVDTPLPEPERRSIRTPRQGNWATSRQVHRGRGPRTPRPPARPADDR
ncbi:MAG: hypothetical protein AAF581_13005, partial [Planctomycetota bacterium]